MSRTEIFLNEGLMGESMTHRIKVKTTTTVKPKGEQFKSFRSKGFRGMHISEDQSFGPESYVRQLINAPDVTDRETLVQLAKMNYNSYTEVASPGWYDLEGNWGVNSTFGWEQEGVRGHVFASKDNSTLIIAIKGTSATFLGVGKTGSRDKMNTVLWTVQDMYPDANIWLTGHSLGGGLASLLGLTFGVPTITFEVPGDRLAAQRLHLPGPPALQWSEFPLFHVGHTADPIFQGVCNGLRSACYISGFALESKCHTGRTCVYDTVGEDKWGVSILKHRLANTIEGVLKVKTVPECKPEKECVDCKQYQFL
ncbi:putative lipase atg15 [Modicella reniformis]|uniref:triacylglycerol lipase n=1 Tax=Modicella reniformis TaxID=1440133 RepID=A0A9P6IPJ0_9FUNG|nr:putative lipase atg15 [Modicella reniformis]